METGAARFGVAQRKGGHGAARPRRLVLALAAAALAWPTAVVLRAQTLPTGMGVAAGQASASVAGNTLTVRNSPDTILNWNSFSIAAGHAVRFEQSNAQSQVLNRVTGNDPSAILGSLSSNGRVWLLNPNGVLFGPDARVDVAGLVVSTLNLNDQDWLAGRYRFTGAAGSNASVVNDGELRSSLGGHIVLLGATVVNQGTVETPGGQTLLAAGAQIELIDTDTPNLSVRIGTTPGAVLNLGRLSAPGGRIDVHAASVNQQGLMQADAMDLGPSGEIVLRASSQLQLGAASQTHADGADGGRVTLDGGAGSTDLSGRLSARGSNGHGGQATLLGGDIRLLDGAAIDVSGSHDGGQALIGGGAQGRDPTLPNARTLLLAAGASVRADATGRGDGGRIVLWSDQATRAYGSLSARGGPLGGAGGWIETSGGWLDARPNQLDVAAPQGPSGSWLLDPYNILISDTAPTTLPNGAGSSNVDGSFSAIGNDAWISSGSLQTALNAGTKVVVSTSSATSPNAGSQAGDITLSAAHITVTALTPGSLTLLADRNIVVSNSNIISASVLTAGPGSALPVTLSAGRSGQGTVAMTGSRIASQGGAININGFVPGTDPNGQTQLSAAGDAGNPVGVRLNSSTLDAGTGALNIKGMGAAAAPLNGQLSAGVLLENSTALTAGDISIYGAGRAGGGIAISASGLHAARSISLLGRGDGIGVAIRDSSGLNFIATPTNTPAVLTIAGRSDTAASGVLIDSSAATIPSTNPGSTIQLANGGDLVIKAGNIANISSAGSSPALKILANPTSPITSIAVGGTGTSTVRLDTSYGGNGIWLDSARIVAPASTVVIDGHGLLTLNSSAISTDRTVRLLADSIQLNGKTSVRAAAPGDAIVLAGPGAAGPMSAFTNLAGPQVFQTAANGGGRWIIYNTDQVAGRFSSGGLVNSFTHYGAAFGDWSADSGSGFAFAARQPVQVATTVEITTQTEPEKIVRVENQPNPAPSLRTSGTLVITPDTYVANSTTNTTNTTNTASATNATNTSSPVNPTPGLISDKLVSAADFGSLAIGNLSTQDLEDLLAARNRYKNILFAEALRQLELDPARADLHLCRTPQEAAEAVCLMTDRQKRLLQAAVKSAAIGEPSPSNSSARPATLAPVRSDLLQHRVKSAALPQIKRKIALVVGIDKYIDTRIPALANAVHDAQAISQLFENVLGYEIIRLENADKSTMVHALKYLAVNLGPNDSVIIYYAGHGALVASSGAGYWQLADSDARIPETWLSNTDIARLVAQIGASQVALISDSCYSGTLLSGERIRAKSGKLDPEPLLARKAVVVMSSGGNEPVFDEGKQGHSLFAWNLMKVLQQVSSWQPGGNVFERVRFAVARELPQRPQYGASTLAGHQSGSDYLFEQRQIEAGY
ncbi:MAG: filamentous hemagglutinin N-terminal domain-containing protein [Leptothrix sp. (in: b-proteobacteria)]